MGYPNKLTLLQRFLSSRQLLPGDWANAVTDALFSFQSVTALGASQAAAAAVNAANVEVLAGSANNAGIRLPTAFPGAVISVLNNSANTTTIYGSGTDTVQTTGTTFAASVTMATLVSTTFFCIKAGFWQRSITA